MLQSLLDSALSSGHPARHAPIQAELESYLQSNGEEIEKDYGVLLKVLQIAFIIHDYGCVSRAVFAHFAVQVDVQFVEAPAFHEIACEWSYPHSEEKPLFVFHQSITLSALPIVIDRWLSLIDLYKKVALSPFNGAVIIDLEDQGKGVGLTFCDNRADSLLIPDPNYMGSRGYRNMRAFFLQHAPVWSSRSDRTFWRGSTTGHRAPGSDVFLLPRMRLCQVARTNPDLFDVAISGIVQMNEEEAGIVKASGYMADYVPWKNLIKYKYHIDIDGNSNSWQALMSKLLTGSLVFKVESPFAFRQWYYDRLIPNVNFVSIKSDMSDLCEKIIYFRGHAREAEEIARNGQAMAMAVDYHREIEKAVKIVQTCAERNH